MQARSWHRGKCLACKAIHSNSSYTSCAAQYAPTMPGMLKRACMVSSKHERTHRSRCQTPVPLPSAGCCLATACGRRGAAHRQVPLVCTTIMSATTLRHAGLSLCARGGLPEVPAFCLASRPSATQLPVKLIMAMTPVFQREILSTSIKLAALTKFAADICPGGKAGRSCNELETTGKSIRQLAARTWHEERN